QPPVGWVESSRPTGTANDRLFVVGFEDSTHPTRANKNRRGESARNRQKDITKDLPGFQVFWRKLTLRSKCSGYFSESSIPRAMPVYPRGRSSESQLLTTFETTELPWERVFRRANPSNA